MMMKDVFVRCRSIGLLLALAAPALDAQLPRRTADSVAKADIARTHRLDPVVVTAARVDAPLTSSAAAVTHLSGAPFVLREYQQASVQVFHAGGAASGGSGVIVLPCGAGKTIEPGQTVTAQALKDVDARAFYESVLKRQMTMPIGLIRSVYFQDEAEFNDRTRTPRVNEDAIDHRYETPEEVGFRDDPIPHYNRGRTQLEPRA